ncbi:related to DNA-directed RNA polymerase I/III chain AC19 [Rhynchosporium agropyri]|uniref:DNA-directed RNA polymerases I and III subunit RPAC2 n=1 Tax=Rhynchosporium agropyri TaxID=914238 RepID=A0A1E1LIX3_9HELO|nr:related to DNA-directed RNA polymerase I/III chain AC19 [Rhynchosporium agropyri]
MVRTKLQPGGGKAANAGPASVEEDVTMGDAPAAVENENMNENPEGEAGMEDDDAVFVFDEEQRIRILPGSSDTAASFEFKNEDHTLGNSLRYIIMKNPDVEFCGYSIPHPSEALMNIRIQTYEGTTAVEALEKGFTDLMQLCDVVADKFCEAREAFTASTEA